MKRYETELDEILLTLGGSIPVEGLKPWHRGCDVAVRSRVTSAIFTEGLDVETFRKLARNLLKTGQAEIIEGYFRIKETK